MLIAATTWRIDGQAINDHDLLAFCLLMFMAGLDTVAMQLACSMYHLARHPDGRQRLNETPQLWKHTEVGGCPIKAGQIVWLPLGSVDRDLPTAPVLAGGAR